MRKRIKDTWDSSVYPCADCCYREPDITFCGFCLREIMGELNSERFDTEQQSPAIIPEAQNKTTRSIDNNTLQSYKGQARAGCTQRLNRFVGYYMEDCDCFYCFYYRGQKLGCSLPVCCCIEEKADALKYGRIHRKPSSMRWYK